MIIATRTSEQFSPFHFFFFGLLSIYKDADEVWISSNRITTGLFSDINGTGKTIGNLLSGKRVHLVSTKTVSTKINYFLNLQNELKKDSSINLFVDEWDEPNNWYVNEIHLLKNDRTVASIIGSSHCVLRDLDHAPNRGKDDGSDLTEFDYKTDMIFHDYTIGSTDQELIDKIIGANYNPEDPDYFRKRAVLLESGDFATLKTDDQLDDIFRRFKRVVDKRRMGQP